MELEEWWNSNSAKDCWAQGFRNAPTPSDDDFKHLILSTTSAFPDQLTAELQLKEIIGLLAEQFLAWVYKAYRGQVDSNANHSETAEATQLVEDTPSSPTSGGDEESEWQQVIVTQYERNRFAQIVTLWCIVPPRLSRSWSYVSS